MYGHPFLLITHPGTLRHLRTIGFETFPEWFDESYDELENFNLRIQAMFDSYEKFLSEEHSIEEIKDSLVHNFNMIHDTYWISSRLVDPMRIIIDRIDESNND